MRTERWLEAVRGRLLPLAFAGVVLVTGGLRQVRAQTSVTVSGPTTLYQGEAAIYNASVYPYPTGTVVTWSVYPPAGVTLNEPGTTSINVTAGTTPGVYTLTAIANNVASGYLNITVPGPPVTSVTPLTAVIAAGQAALFSASVINSDSPYFFWSTDDPSGIVAGGGGAGTGPVGQFSHIVGRSGGLFHVYVVNNGDGNYGVQGTATVQVVDVAVAPAAITVLPGTARQFFADVTGSQQSVQWSSTLPGATFSSTGLLQVPANAAAGSYTVTVQTVGNPLATSTAALTVVSTMPVSGVAVSPSRSVIDSGQQEPFTAVVEDPNGEPHPNQAVTWSVAGPGAASIAANGLFTAPAVPGVFTVTATAVANPTQSGTATVTVGEDLEILPSSPSLAPGASQAFTAQVSGVANPAVTWSVEEGSAGGSITTAGLYTAPVGAGVYHVLALSTAAGGGPVQGLATVTVSAGPLIGIAVAPAETAVAAGGLQQFTATVAGAADTGVLWSVSAGSIDATGLFTAPTTDGTVTITAASHADPQVQASATAVVTVPGQGQAFQYDANGNLLSDGTRTYEWDAENRLTAINIGSQRSQFAYDGLGRRALITELNNGAVVSSRHYIWVEDQIVEETDATVDPTGAVTAPGNFDSLNCNQVAGWAWNPAQPNTPVSVSIESGTTSEATVLANNYRSDLKLAGAGNGNHGFTYPLPAQFKTGTAQAATLLLTGTTTSLGTRTVTCTAPSFSGSFASPSCTQLAGWAWDATEPNDPINVDIYDGTTLIVTVLANTFRQDLENAGIGNGVHGFFLPTPAALKTGTAHTITLKAGGTPTVIGAPQTLTCSSANFAGFFDYADCTQLAGWAWDANQPNAALNVDLYDNGALLATIPAATFRQDLQTAGKGNGDHGFTYTSPALYSGTTHSLSVTYSGTTIPLGGTPKTITCPTEPILTRFFPGGMQSSGTNYYFTYDRLGSVREVTDPNGKVVSRYDYDPYGRLTINQGTPPRFGFAGTYYHQPSGLSLTEYRAYDPNLGRWESRDPLGEIGGEFNLYRYTGGDPINLIDPLGLATIEATPPNAVTYLAPDGQCFYAPPGVDWNEVHKAGHDQGLLGAADNVAQKGRYDVQRSGDNFYLAYVHASNYAVGVYMNGAGIPLWATDVIGKTYGLLKSDNTAHNDWVTWWANGWNAANSGRLPAKPCKCRPAKH